MNNYIFIINPYAGYYRFLPSISHFKRRIIKKFPDSKILIPKEPKILNRELFKIIDERSKIIICGGDGTIHFILEKTWRLKNIFGIIPLGTSNNIANSLKIPLSFSKALEILDKGKIENIDIASANNKTFIESCGIGFHANILKLYETGSKKDILKGIYSILKVLSSIPNFDIKLKLGNKYYHKQIIQLLVLNFPYYSFGLHLSNRIIYNDNKLNILIFNKADKQKMLKYIIYMMSGKILKAKGIEHYVEKNLEIITNRDIPLHTDGFVYTTTPCKIKIIGKVNFITGKIH